MLEQVRFLGADLKRWHIGSLKKLLYCLFEGGIWVTILFRVGRICYLVEIPVVRIAFRLVSFLLFKLSEILFGVSLSPSASIGPGLHIGHTGLIVVHPAVRIGRLCTMTHGVTLGTAGLGKEGAPVLGDNVFLGAGAKVLGNVVIGNNAKIGANAVVVSDIPSNSTAVGVPARVVNR